MGTLKWYRKLVSWLLDITIGYKRDTQKGGVSSPA